MRYLLDCEYTQVVEGRDPVLMYQRTFTLPYHHPARARYAKTHHDPGYDADPSNPVKIEEGDAGVFRFTKVFTSFEGERVTNRGVVTLTPLPPGNPLRGMKPVRGRNGL